MIDQATVDDYLDRLRIYPKVLDQVVDGVEDQRLSRAAADGGWGPVEVFCHLRDIDELWIDRITRIVDEDRPVLPVIDESLWAIERDYASENPRQALAQFGKRRAKLLDLLEELDDEDWQRTGRHIEIGTQSVQDIVEYAIGHDRLHLDHLHDLLRGDL